MIYNAVSSDLLKASKPLIIAGSGVRGLEGSLRKFSKELGIPMVVTWAARDMFPEAIGTFGTHGTKAANLAVQNCDWLLSLGCRLDTKATGSLSLFAPKAKRWMVDIDQTEIDKFKYLGLEITGINSTVGDFLRGWNSNGVPEFVAWARRCQRWKKQHPPGPGHPYEIMKILSRYLKTDDTIVSDTGCVLAWAMQSLDLSCRFIHAWNMTPMGYGLPASIGAAFATGKRVILLTGDGGFSVNITELATVTKHKLPIKILLFNNLGHAMCRQTQRVWLDGNYFGTSQNDLATPDFPEIAKAYKISIHLDLKTLFQDGKSGFIEFNIDENQGVIPQVNFGEALA